MNIDFKTPEITIVVKKFTGSMDDGRTYNIYAEWNGDIWFIHGIMWDQKGGTKDEEEEISEYFYSENLEP